jgi:Ca2+-binding EF-hand superfamily protein
MGNKNNKLSEKELTVLTQQTSLTRQELTDLHKKFLTKYKRGYVDKKEFREFYSDVYGKQEDTEKFADFAFTAFDKVTCLCLSRLIFYTI